MHPKRRNFRAGGSYIEYIILAMVLAVTCIAFAVILRPHDEIHNSPESSNTSINNVWADTSDSELNKTVSSTSSDEARALADQVNHAAQNDSIPGVEAQTPDSTDNAMTDAFDTDIALAEAPSSTRRSTGTVSTSRGSGSGTTSTLTGTSDSPATGQGKVTFSNTSSGGSGGGSSGSSSGSSYGGGSSSGGSSSGGGSSGSGGGSSDSNQASADTSTASSGSDAQSGSTNNTIDGVNPVATARNLNLQSLNIPTGPEGVTFTDAPALPRLAITSTKQTPQISMISDITHPGETLVITGDNLRGARLGVWVNGREFTISPMRSLDDRTMAILPKNMNYGYGDATEHATTLVWPVRDFETGNPIRVNAPVAWWAWPCRVFTNEDSRTLRVFGKNLTVAAGQPMMYIQSLTTAPRKLKIVKQSPYSLEASLPDNLSTGLYKVWVHNGTGGDAGWSEHQYFEVVKPIATSDEIFQVDDYVDAEHNDSQAIDLAIKNAQAAGGGVVKFSSRTYNLTSRLTVPEGNPVILRGAGMGKYNDDTKVFTGPGTLIRTTTEKTKGTVIKLQGRGSTVEDMTIAYVHDGDLYESGLMLEGKDQKVRRTRVIYSGYNLGACITSKGPISSANHVVTDCEFHTQMRGYLIDNGVNNVRINNCKFRGYFSSGRGVHADAITNRGANQVLVENCDIQSHDRAGGEVFSRTYLAYHNSIRNNFIANNRSTYMGPTPAVENMEANLGEQYLFHPHEETEDQFWDQGKSGNKGKYAIYQSTPQTVTLAKSGPKVVPYHENDWIIFIARGKGAGQFRIITNIQGKTLELEKPWRVIPDRNSVAIIQRVFRQNIVYNNYVDASPDPELINSNYKTSGVYWWHLSFDNVTASNVLQNIAQGISIATDGNLPSAWNITRDNKISAMAGWAGGNAAKPMFYCEHNRGNIIEGNTTQLTHWSSVGNVFRANDCSGADAAAQVGWLRYKNAKYDKYQASINSGMAMSVIENNRFMDVDQGILLSPPANWTMIRNNTMDINSFRAEQVEMHDPENIIDAYVPGKLSASFD